jgi:hypothetical protein
MSKINFVLAAILIFGILAACGSNQADNGGVEDASQTPVVVVGGQSYTPADLETMPQTEATFNDVTYVGVQVSELLAAAGYDLASVTAIKAVASDGYTVNYEPGQLMAENIIVAYAQVDGALTADDGDFRMVIPDGEGNLNLRMLVELQVIE